MRASLRFFVPLAVCLAAVAWGAATLFNRQTWRWAERDVAMRGVRDRLGSRLAHGEHASGELARARRQPHRQHAAGERPDAKASEQQA